MKVVQLYDHNFRDAAKTLHMIAERIEAGHYGEVDCVAVVVAGDSLEVMGAGRRAEPHSVATLLQIGNMNLVRAIYGMEDDTLGAA